MNNCFSIITQVIIKEKLNKNCPKNVEFVGLFSFKLLRVNEQRRAVTCSIEITWSIDKLHMPQAECQYSLTVASLRRSIDFCECMLGFSDPFTKTDGDEPGCLVITS